MIYINASDVAAVCGFNRFKSIKDMVKLYLAKLKGREKTHVREKEYGVLSEQTTQKLCALAAVPYLPDNKNKAAETAIKAISEPAVIATTAKEADKTQVKICKIGQASCCNDVEKQAVQKAVQAFVAKERGIRRETKATDKLEKKRKTPIQKRNEQKYYFNGPQYVLVGKIDGCTDDNMTLIETKNRRSRLFGFIPKYEKIQLEVYMRMLNVKRAILNEHFNEDMNTIAYN